MNPRAKNYSIGLLLVGLALTAAPASGDAPAGRYTIQGGTVLDTKTGLTWQQSVPANGGDDGTGRHSQPNAVTYCHNLTLAGGGWRLPTIKELTTIVDYTGFPVTIDTTAFPNTPFDPDFGQTYPVWSATRYAGNPASSWYADFGAHTGTVIDSYSNTFLTFARCVR